MARHATHARPQPALAGFTLIEMMVAIGIAALVMALAIPGISEWAETQRARGAARSVADLLILARSEAMRTSRNHVVFFGNPGQTDPSGNDVELGGSWVPVLAIDDGPPAAANCAIGGGEVLEGVEAIEGMGWGVSAATGPVSSDAGTAPFDPGGGWDGATFVDPDGNKVNWLLFRPDGVPVTFVGAPGGCGAIGSYGTAGGAFYVTNDTRDFAVVLSPLGGVRLHLWNAVTAGWSH